MLEQDFRNGFAQEFVAVLFFLAVFARRGIAFTALDFAIDDSAIRNRLDIGIDHDLTTTTVMVNFHVLDAVVSNIYTDSFAFSANFSD